MKKAAIVIIAWTALSIVVAAQSKSKPWTEWSKKDVEKMLNESAWGQTQTETDTSEMTYSPTISPTTPSRDSEVRGTSASRVGQGALNQPISVKYRIRFLSAKPIRQAFASSVVAQQGGAEAKPEFIKQMQEFVDRDFKDYVVVAVAFESKDGRFSGKAMQAFNSAVASTLKNTTYLERKDGKRVFLMDYKAPIADGMGAKFVFPRMIDGNPFLDLESGEVRFYSELDAALKLNMRFKVKAMVYEDKLEY